MPRWCNTYLVIWNQYHVHVVLPLLSQLEHLCSHQATCLMAYIHSSESRWMNIVLWNNHKEIRARGSSSFLISSPLYSKSMGRAPLDLTPVFLLPNSSSFLSYQCIISYYTLYGLAQLIRFSALCQKCYATKYCMLYSL